MKNQEERISEQLSPSAPDLGIYAKIDRMRPCWGRLRVTTAIKPRHAPVTAMPGSGGRTGILGSQCGLSAGLLTQAMGFANGQRVPRNETALAVLA